MFSERFFSNQWPTEWSFRDLGDFLLLHSIFTRWTGGKCLPFLSQSSICFTKKKAFLDVQFFRSETNMTDLNISVNKHETCGNVWGKMVELLKNWRPSRYFLEKHGGYWSEIMMKCMDNWYWLSILIIQGRPDTLQHWAIGNAFNRWQVPELGGGNMRTATLACEKHNWSGLKFSKKGYIYFSYIYIYIYKNLPFQKVVWSRIWEWHFSNFGWWNWQLVNFVTHRYVDESPNTPAFAKNASNETLVSTEQWGEFISSLRLGWFQFFCRGFGMGEQKRDHWIIPEIFCFIKRRWLENLNLCFRTLYSSILVVSPFVLSSKLWFGWKSFFGIPGRILFSIWNTWSTTPCIPPVAIRHVKYLWHYTFHLSPWAEGGFFIATGEIPPLRLYEWSYSTDTCIISNINPFLSP